MRGISEDRLRKIANETHDSDDTNMPVLSLLDMLMAECKELNPWMTLEEFLKSGFEGLCWVCVNKVVYDLIEYRQGAFYFGSSKLRTEVITHVQPIHKPEPPR